MACFVILGFLNGAGPVRLLCSAACRCKTPARVIRGGHGTLICLGHARWDGAGVQHFQWLDTPTGSSGAGLFLKYRWCGKTCGGRTTLHVTIEFSLPVRSVSIIFGSDGHVRSDKVLTDGSHRQASNLKIVEWEAIQSVILVLSSSPRFAQAVCG